MPDARKLAREKREKLREILESDEADDLTQDEIAERVGCSTASVQRYAQRWDLDGDAGDRVRSRGDESPFRQEPVDRLEEALRAWQIPSYAPERFSRALSIVEANPGLLASPDQLHQFLSSEIKLKAYTSEQIVRAVFQLNNPHAPGSAAGGSLPPSGAVGGPFSQPQRQTVTRDDLGDIVKEAVAEVVEQLDGTRYEEVAEPVLDDGGNILRDESGTPIRRIRKRPIDAGGNGGADAELLQALLESKVAAARAEERAEREQALAEVRASQSLDGESMVIRDGIQAVEKQAARFTEKTDSRLDRLERAAMIILSEGGAENLPTGDVELEDLEDLRKRQIRIDAREAGGNPHVDAENRVDQRVDEHVDEPIDRGRGAGADADDALEDAVSSSRWPGSDPDAGDDVEPQTVPTPPTDADDGDAP